MPTAPKPISLTSATESPDPQEPQPFLLVLPGYDAEETQTLKHVDGVLQWVTDTP